MQQRPNILVYREDLLGASETFILSQAEALQNFQPIYVGLREVPGLKLPVERRVMIGGNRLAAARLKTIGPSAAELRQLRKFNPVLIHAHFGMDATRAMLIARSLNVPLIATFHGYDATVDDQVFRKESLGLRLYIHRRPQLAKRAAKIICVSEFIRKEMLAKRFPEDKLQVQFTGIDVRYFSADPRIEREPVVLFTGRLVPKKGCALLIEAMARVQTEIPETRLVVIGDGPLRESLRAAASEKLRHFDFLGSQPQSVIRDWMNRARVFSTPSIVAESGDTEGFGMVFAEAQSMGLPVASFATGGIPEAVMHGETGLLAQPHDVEALAMNIIRMMKDTSMWSYFSFAGERRVRDRFDIQKLTSGLEQVYQQAAA